ncbi:MAG: hypothetical protein IJA59_05945 [Clostridia bacterium]|nr:hypothetical protein [Clostridia bacterium]
MRLSDAMTPARSWEEAAMTVAHARTMLGGAALKSVKTIANEIETLEVTTDKNPAAGKAQTIRRRRAALRHALERQF